MVSFQPLLLVCLLCAPAFMLAQEQPTHGTPRLNKGGSVSAASSVALDEYGIPIRYFVQLNEDAISSQKTSNADARRGVSSMSAQEETNSAVESLIKEILQQAPSEMRLSSSSSTIEPKTVLSDGVSLEISADLADTLSNDPRVNNVEQDAPVFFQDSPADRTLLDDEEPYGIGMVKADQVDELDGPIKVCVIDSGLNTDHEEFSQAKADGKLTGTSVGSYNWEVDLCHHGSHCAGTIAARGDNDVGVTSVNPKGLLKIHSVQVFANSNCGWIYNSGLKHAMEDCVAQGAKVISMSLGGGGGSTTTKDWMESQTDVLFFAAAGNGGSPDYMYPASYDIPNLASVAAVNSQKQKASFSQWNDQVDLSGPGVSVKSTTSGPDGYDQYSGTSMACPHVAGVAALVWNRNPSCSATQVMTALLQTVEDLGASGRDDEYGHGLVDAKSADAMLSDDCGGSFVPPTNAPTPVPPPPEAEFRFSVTYDNYPGETTYKIFDSTGGEVTGLQQLTLTTTTVEGSLQKDKPYTFTVYDSFGDGLCCSYGPGGYEVSTRLIAGEYEVIRTGGVFTATDSFDFTISEAATSPTPAIVSPTPAPTSAVSPTAYPSSASFASSMPTPAPTATGTCCEGRGAARCEDLTCETAVCTVDSYCCDDVWDRKCVDLAENLCPEVCTGPTCCFGRAEPGCDAQTCEIAVCKEDSYCCDKFWDRQCVQLADNLCTDVC